MPFSSEKSVREVQFFGIFAQLKEHSILLFCDQIPKKSAG